MHCAYPTDYNSNLKFREVAIVKSWMIVVKLRLYISVDKFQFDPKGQEIMFKLAKKY